MLAVIRRGDADHVVAVADRVFIGRDLDREPVVAIEVRDPYVDIFEITDHELFRVDVAPASDPQLGVDDLAGELQRSGAACRDVSVFGVPVHAGDGETHMYACVVCRWCDLDVQQVLLLGSAADRHEQERDQETVHG